MSFDKPDSITVILPKGVSLVWAAYQQQRRGQSLSEIAQKQIDRDRKIRKKFPYDSYQQDSPISHINIIPKENIGKRNDSTYIVYFKSHANYSRKNEIRQAKYYKNRDKTGKSRTRWSYVENESDVLEPVKKYILFFALTDENSVNLFETLHRETLARPQTYQETSRIIADAVEKERNKLGVSFFDYSLASYITFYIKNLSDNYNKIDQKKAAIKDSVKTADALLMQIAKDNRLQKIMLSVKNETQWRRAEIGMSRDSISLIFNSLSTIYSVNDSNFCHELNTGQSNILNPVVAYPYDSIANIQLTRSALAKLVGYINYYIIDSVLSRSDTTAYKLKYSILRWISLLDASLNLANDIKKEKAAIADKIKTDDRFARVEVNASSSYAQDIVTRGKFSFAPDFGAMFFGFAPWRGNNHFRSVRPYLGFQFNLRPYDQSVPFQSIPSSRKQFYKLIRWSAFMGVTFVSVKEKGKREDLFGSSNLALGVGYRFTTEIRGIAGAMLFRKYSSDYLSNSKSLGATGFVGVSIDLNLKDLFNNVLGVFTGK